MPDKTPLHDWHASHGGRIVDFAGWSMPVIYSSITEEHRATRTAVGLFDVSHMGRLDLVGDGAAVFLDGLTTRRVTDMVPGEVRYSLVCNAQGGILDDVLVYCHARTDGFEDASGDAPRAASDPRADKPLSRYSLVVNASNRAKIVAWFDENQPDSHGVTVLDRTTETAMIAVQGPTALTTVQTALGLDATPIAYYHSRWLRTVDGMNVLVSRTGYTGEDGVELILPADQAVAVWERLVSAGGTPCGLGSRDTLRLEAAMPLYGHELSESIDPLTAGLKFAVDLDGRTFSGSDVLATVAARGASRRRVGLMLSDRRVPRETYPVLIGDDVIGEVSSGTFSPTLDRPIAMAIVDAGRVKIGQTVEIAVRNKRESAEVVRLPFYRRSGA